MASKLTKQGVRDLNHLKGPPKGVRLPEPPSFDHGCKHKKTYEAFEQSGVTWFRCEECGGLTR